MSKKKVFIIFLLLISNFLFARDLIRVGAYDFPPFIEWHSKIGSGLTAKLIAELNQVQDKVTFELVETSSMRRYEDFKLNKIDALFFESHQWGWQNEKEIESSNVFLKGGEVFIALNKNKDQSYFKELKNKKIKGITGYHYGFLNFSTDASVLKSFDFETTNSHEGNIKSVLEGRADLAIVTKEYLTLYLAKNPEEAKILLVSKNYDQEYKHTILLRSKSAITIKELNLLLKKLGKNKFFLNFFN